MFIHISRSKKEKITKDITFLQNWVVYVAFNLSFIKYPSIHSPNPHWSIQNWEKEKQSKTERQKMEACEISFLLRRGGREIKGLREREEREGCFKEKKKK